MSDSLDFSTRQAQTGGLTQAWSAMIKAMMAANTERFEMLGTLWTNQATLLHQVGGPGAPGDVTRHMLQSAWSQYDEALKGMRRINDDLAGGLFGAAEALLDSAPAGIAAGASPKTVAEQAAGIEARALARMPEVA